MLTLASIDEALIPIAISGAFATVWIVHIVVRGFARSHAEQTKREIAAYVAEGSISPDDAERILNAGGKSPKL
ncbi:MAG TPA: hypothetical protein VG797_04210 [Phycisphaerales bacterium]|nr:hypothetical protein [Phycisphaerales bacterium]